jgi:hypothetical protein
LAYRRYSTTTWEALRGSDRTGNASHVRYATESTYAGVALLRAVYTCGFV